MTWQLLHDGWPLLAVLIYLLVTTVLNVLATQRRFAIELHNRIREAKSLRAAYLRELEARRQEVEG